MQATHLLRGADPRRLFRAAILNSTPVPPIVITQLEARGINVGELEQRIRQMAQPASAQNMEFVR